MIDVKELRLGSYIYDENLHPQQVSEITNFNRVCFGSNRIVEDLQNCTPIPLTEELLLKCGFAYNSIDDCFDGLNLRVRISWDSICAFIGFEVAFGKKWYDANLEVKSLHQLQNIYLDLTGKELEVSL